MSNKQEWTNFYSGAVSTGDALTYPSETLIRLLKGNYVKGLDHKYDGKKVIDVGCGACNNTALLCSLKFDVSGTEISEEIVSVCRDVLGRHGMAADIRVGENTSIPFPDNYFDYLVSWNVIHYEDNEDSMLAAIAEYQRVLKPEGRFFISSTGPDHKILDGGRAVGSHIYEIGRTDDFRQGTRFFYFDNELYIRYIFGKYFKDIEVGRTRDKLISETLDWFIFTGVK